jgi:hypothetical protein
MESHENIVRAPVGVMDQDSSLSVVSREDYRSAKGIRNGIGSNPGQVDWCEGNEQVFVDLPPDDSISVGHIVDKESEVAFFFIYNSTGRHQIRRWDPNANNSVGEVEVVAEGAALGFTPNTRIHHGTFIDNTFLCWVDGKIEGYDISGTEPRKLDISKATRTSHRQWSVYAGIDGQGQFPAGTIISLEIDDDDGNTILASTNILGMSGSQEGDPEAGLAAIFNALSSFASLNPSLGLDIEDCGKRIKIISTVDNYHVSVTSSNNDLLVVPDNHYNLFSKENTWLIRPTPQYPPMVCYEVDPSVQGNYVRDKLFQFRVRYHYYDGTKSAMGPISGIPLPLDQAGVHLESLNTIKVDFTEDRLADLLFLQDLSYVEVLVREGNSGLWKSVANVTKEDIGIGSNFYHFYNDKLYSAAASDEDTNDASIQALKLFDRVPRVSSAMESVTDRSGNSTLLLMGNLENYDVPDCVDAKFEIIEDDINGSLITIRGRIAVQRTTAQEASSTNDYYYRNSLHTPALDGFVVYLAGTDYYGISDSFDVSSDGTFTIENVPKGIYVLRVASDKCRNGSSGGNIYDLTSGLQWQRSSAPVVDCAGSLAATGIAQERIIDLTMVNEEFDLLTEPGYGEIIIQEWEFSNNGTGGIELYALDNDADSSSNALRLSSIGMERQRVDLRINLSGSPIGPNAIPGELYTDHNGYAWKVWDESLYPGLTATIGEVELIVENVVGITEPTISVFRATTGNGDIWECMNSGVESDTTSDATTPGLDFDPLFSIAIFNNDTDVSTNNRTVIQGTMTDVNGVGIEAIVVCLTRNGRQESTDASGNYSITVWCPYVAGNNPSNRDDDTLVYTYPADIGYSFPPDPPSLTPDIGLFGTEVDKDTPYEIEDIMFTFSGVITLKDKYYKSGGVYQFFVVYEDEPGRKSVAIPAGVVRVPFHTESGTYARRRIRWKLFSKPPDWAFRYHWARSRDAVYGRYLPWLVDNVRYVVISEVDQSPTDTTFGAGDATHILLKIGAAIDPVADGDPVQLFYKETNEFGFSPRIGDRVRLVLDEAEQVLPGNTIYDYEIIGQYLDGDDVYAVIKAPQAADEILNNYLVEFYTPRKTEDIVAYGTGDSFPINNPGTGNQTHAGQVQDQDFIVSPVDPAIGIFSSGDTYWRTRNFVVDPSIAFTYLTANANFSDSFDSIEEDIGMAFPIDPMWKERFSYNEIRFSDIYIPNSSVNGISSFRGLSVQQVNRAYGPIYAGKLVGGVLAVVCKTKLQPIYVGKDMLLSLDGNNQTGRSDRLLNIANEVSDDLGTQHPETIVVEKNRMYGWDAIEGVPWAYGQNGQQRINKKMQRFFRDLGRDVASDPQIRCFAAFERQHGCYLLVALREGQKKEYLAHISYDENKNGWNTFRLFEPQEMITAGNKFASMKDSQLWVHWDGAPQMNFYGEDLTPEIQLVFNDNPSIIKDFWNVEAMCDSNVYFPLITTPANIHYPIGQESRIPIERVSNYNGKVNADFLADMNDPKFLHIPDNAQREAQAMLNGRLLKNNLVVVTIRPESSSNPLGLKVVAVEYSASFDTK